MVETFLQPLEDLCRAQMWGPEQHDILNPILAAKRLNVNSGDEPAHAVGDDVDLGRFRHFLFNEGAKSLGVIEIAQAPIVIEDDDVTVMISDVVQRSEQRGIDIALPKKRNDADTVDQAAFNEAVSRIGAIEWQTERTDASRDIGSAVTPDRILGLIAELRAHHSWDDDDRPRRCGGGLSERSVKKY